MKKILLMALFALIATQTHGMEKQTPSKTTDEALSYKWIAENTKACPSCQARIEKVAGGCLHMTCRKCSHSFCWSCLKEFENNQSCQQYMYSKKCLNAMPPLIQACIANDTNRIKELLLDPDIDVNAEDDEYSPLGLAAANGNLEIFKLLVGHGAIIHNGSCLKPGILAIAARCNNDNVDLIEFIIQQGGKVYTEQYSPLSCAVLKGNEKICIALLKHVSHDPKQEFYATTDALFKLISQKNNSTTHIARMLINKGANVHLVNGAQMTLLMIAAVAQKVDLCKLLLESGANLYAQSATNKTVFNIIRPSEKINLLLNQAKDRSQALFQAIEQNNTQAITEIVKPLNVTNLPNPEGITPLRRTIELGNIDMCKELLKCGANPCLKDSNNLTAFDHASLNEQDGMLELLHVYTKGTLKNRCLRAIIEANEGDSDKIFSDRATKAHLNLLPSFIEIAEMKNDEDTHENN